MTWIEHLVSDPRFWVSHLVGTSGHIAPGLDETGWGDIFEDSPDDAWHWMKKAAGVGSGKEVGLRISQNAGVSIHMELTEEMDFWIQDDASDVSFLTANVGGHWLLPGLRWAELVAASRIAHPVLPMHIASSLVICLLLPSVWFCAPDELAVARSVLPKAFLEVGAVTDLQRANLLAEAWVCSVNAFENDVLHSWQRDAKGWWSSSEHSCRSKSREDRPVINQLLQRLIGET